MVEIATLRQNQVFFSQKRAGELHLIILRRKKKPGSKGRPNIKDPSQEPETRIQEGTHLEKNHTLPGKPLGPAKGLFG
jgi:hypothetical protein